MTTKPEEKKMRPINTNPTTLDQYFANQQIIREDYQAEYKRLQREIELLEQYRNRASMANIMNAGKNGVFQVRLGDLLKNLAKEYEIEVSDIEIKINASKKMAPDQKLGEKRPFINESDSCMEIRMICTNPSKTFEFVDRIPLILNMKLSDGSLLIDHLTKTNKTLFDNAIMSNHYFIDFDMNQAENLLLHFPPNEGPMGYGKFEKAVYTTIREKEREQNIAKAEQEKTK